MKALMIGSFCESETYHLVEKPLQTVTSFDSLNEKTISEMIEERRQMLRSLAEKSLSKDEKEQRGVVSSIKRFFGLK